ncbi:MAG: beta-lactamase family protein [Gemmatimonadetes bacterium]|nr:beta-lactamase family protein [Gemmatimonadota bacterium]
MKTVPARAFALVILALAVPTVARAQASAATPAPVWAAALDSAMRAEMSRTLTPGAQIAVVVDGKLAYTRGYGVADIESGRVVTDRTLFRVGSVTKMITAATLTQLAADGKLDLQAPISTYVPELAGKRVGAVTSHQLLTHTAGWVDNAVAYGRMGEGALGEVMRVVNDTLFFTEPGRVISYSNPGYSMAGYVAEMAAKQRFGTTVDQLVLRNMGMPHATFRPLEALTYDFSQGHVGAPGTRGTIVRPFTENTAQWTAGFLFASAGELARFTIALMAGGMLDGRRVLAEEAVRRMTTGHQAIPGSTTVRYGYGLNIGVVGAERVWQHGGAINGFDAQVTMFPDRKLAVIVIDNRGGAPMQGLIDLVAQRAGGIAPAKPPALPPERDASAAERAQLVGTYSQGGTTLTLAERNGALRFLQGTQDLPVRLVGDERIVVIDSPTEKDTLLLVRSPGGRVEFLHSRLRALARQP